MDTRGTLENGRKIVERFLDSKEYYFFALKPSDIPEKPGVYAIFNAEETLYVGRTKNLRRRLYTNHLMGPLTNVRLKKYILGDSSLSHITTPKKAKGYLKENCYCQFMVCDTTHTERGRLEGLLSFALGVKYLYEEH